MPRRKKNQNLRDSLTFVASPFSQKRNSPVLLYSSDNPVTAGIIPAADAAQHWVSPTFNAATGSASTRQKRRPVTRCRTRNPSDNAVKQRNLEPTPSKFPALTFLGGRNIEEPNTSSLEDIPEDREARNRLGLSLMASEDLGGDNQLHSVIQKDQGTCSQGNTPRAARKASEEVDPGCEMSLSHERLNGIYEPHGTGTEPRRLGGDKEGDGTTKTLCPLTIYNRGDPSADNWSQQGETPELLMDQGKLNGDVEMRLFEWDNTCCEDANVTREALAPNTPEHEQGLPMWVRQRRGRIKAVPALAKYYKVA